LRSSHSQATPERIDTLLARATRQLQVISEDPRLEAELLLCHAVGWARARLYAHPEEVPPLPAQRQFADSVARRRRGEPLAYLTGEQPFRDFELLVTPATLIPRADTETLVEAALMAGTVDTRLRVLELGTGSGAVALALARARPAWQITATDNSAAALAVARLNARRLGLERRVHLQQADWFDGLAAGGETAGFDLIVSNPPYIAENDPHLADPGLAAEPRQALVSGPDGLTAIRRIAGGAPAWAPALASRIRMLAALKPRAGCRVGGCVACDGAARVAGGTKAHAGP
jgi:release factor glutamine methyltransferase